MYWLISLYLNSYNFTHMTLRIFVLSVLLTWVTLCDNILIILDNALLKQTHSQLIELLQSTHNVEIAYTFGKTKIELKTYDRFKYHHVIVMGLSAKESASQIKANDIVSYFDQGGNVVIVADIDTEKSFRKLFYAFGVELDEYGSKLKDYFNYNGQVDILKTSNYVSAPFLHTTKPLLYQGTGLNLVNYQNYQLYELVSSQTTTHSRNYIKEQTQKIGRTSIIVGVQGLNNARALLLGSLYFFSNDALSKEGFDNSNAVKDLLSWTFRKTGIVRASNLHYHGQGATNKQSLFNVGQKIYFKVDVETQQLTNWQPFSTQDLQVQFVMLDPWVRVPLTQIKSTATYEAQFYAPGKQGIYQFKIIYKKPGYTFLTISERVTVRPYKHDEYQRFLLVAYPYQFGLVATIVGTFVFIVAYLYSSFSQQKAKQD